MFFVRFTLHVLVQYVHCQQINGMLGLSWAAMWAVVSAANPAAQQGFIPVSTADSPVSSKGPKAQGTSTPWKALLLQPAIWAIVVCFSIFAHDISDVAPLEYLLRWCAIHHHTYPLAQINNYTFHYAFYVIMNWLPTYCVARLGTDLASLGILKTLPYVVMFVSSNLGAWGGDWLIAMRHWPVARARKAVNTAGVFAVLSLFPCMSHNPPPPPCRIPDCKPCHVRHGICKNHTNRHHGDVGGLGGVGCCPGRLFRQSHGHCAQVCGGGDGHQQHGGHLVGGGGCCRDGVDARGGRGWQQHHGVGVVAGRGNCALPRGDGGVFAVRAGTTGGWVGNNWVGNNLFDDLSI